MAYDEPSSRSTYTRLPEAEALLPAQQPASTTDVETGKQEAHAQFGDAPAAPAPQGGSVFEMAYRVIPNGVTRGLGTCLTLVLASLYALFSITGVMAAMLTDASGKSDLIPGLVEMLVAYWVLGGLATAAICCISAIRAGPHSPWYMKYSLNMAPALAHFLGIVLFVCLISAIAGSG